MSSYSSHENPSDPKKHKKIIPKKSHNIMPQKNNTVQYDAFGETFAQSRRNMRWSEITEVLMECAKRTPSTGVLADIGCWSGRLLTHIWESSMCDFYKENFWHYIGLDTSQVLLDEAKNQDWSDIFPVIDWKIGDMRDIESQLSSEGLFDIFFFIASFHHLGTFDERISVLKQAKKLLSPTGIIAMTNWNLSHPSQIKYLSSCIQKYPDNSADYSIKIGEHERFYHAFSEQEYVSLWKHTWLTPDYVFQERNSIVYWS